MKKGLRERIQMGALGLCSLGAFALLSQQVYAGDHNSWSLDCRFQAPAHRIQATLNLAEGDTQVLQSWPKNPEDFLDPNAEQETALISEQAWVQIKAGGREATVQISDERGLLLSGTVNYLGNDGLQDMSYPMEVVYYRGGQVGDPGQRGGCYVGMLPAMDFDRYRDERDLVNLQSAAGAMTLCINRAVAEWTAWASEYQPNRTVFSVLYRRAGRVPLEPANFSRHLNQEQRRTLSALLAEIADPPEDGASFYRVQAAKWQYCQSYATELNVALARLFEE